MIVATGDILEAIDSGDRWMPLVIGQEYHVAEGTKAGFGVTGFVLQHPTLGRHFITEHEARIFFRPKGQNAFTRFAAAAQEPGYFLSGGWDWTPPPPPVCTCGAKAVGSTRHSTWCDVKE